MPCQPAEWDVGNHNPLILLGGVKMMQPPGKACKFLKMLPEQGVVAHTCSASYCGAEAGGEQPGQHGDLTLE